MTLLTAEELVRDFHRAFGHPVERTPALVGGKLASLRLALIDEEVDELATAIAAGDLVEIADALADIVWVCYGAAAVYGIRLDDVLDEVSRANMSKLGVDGQPIYAGPNDPDGLPEGKIKKGPNYSPPDVREVLRKQGARL